MDKGQTERHIDKQTDKLREKKDGQRQTDWTNEHIYYRQKY